MVNLGYMNLEEGFIVCSYEEKMELLKTIKEIKDYTFLDINELEHKLLGNVNKSAVFILMKQYELPYDLAVEYMSYMPYVEDKVYLDLKLDSILAAKKFLIKEGFYEKEPYFINQIKGRKITFYHIDDNSKVRYLKSLLSPICTVLEYDEAKTLYQPSVYSFDDITLEVLAVANEMRKLKESGVSLNRMYLCNLDENYIYLFRRVFDTYQLAIDLPSQTNILWTEIARKFLSLCETKNSFEEIFNELDFKSDFYSTLFQMVISYDLEDKNPSDYIEFFKTKMKEVSYPKHPYEEMISCKGKIKYSDLDYVFYVGLNLGVAPRIYKDDLYLNDEELKRIHLLSSLERNQQSKNQLKDILLKTKNIWISFKKYASSEAYLPSNIISELNLDIIDKEVSYGTSKIEDDLRLGIAYTKLLKYKQMDEGLNLYSIEDLNYGSYDHRFKGISSELLQKKFENKPLKMAYSNLKTYFQCPFAYYADRILGLNEFNPNMAARLGTFSHAVLEDSYQEDFNFMQSVEKNTKEIATDAKDTFYFSVMSDVLKDLISYNQRHEESSMLKTIEREIHIEYKEDDLLFEGYIDKLMYTEIQGEIYAAIVDYKTGKDQITLDNVKDGFHLQLPAYMFLLSKYEGFQNKKIHIIGIYLQKVNIIALDNTMDLVTQREKSFRLQGYSVKRYDYISMLDPEYDKSEYIHGLSTLKDGSFSKYSKLLTEEEEMELIEIVDGLIHQAHQQIKTGDFRIEPKRIDNINQSCTYCKYKDLCYRTYEDFKDLKKDPYPKKEGDSNGVD